MLYAKEFDSLWIEALNTSVYVLNLTELTTEGKNPYQLWYDKNIPDINHLRMFQSDCYVHIPKQKRQNWERLPKD